jgi:hypothetical protein
MLAHSSGSWRTEAIKMQIKPEPWGGPPLPNILTCFLRSCRLLCSGPPGPENTSLQSNWQNPSQAESGLKDWLHRGKLSVMSCAVHSTADKEDQPRITPVSLRGYEWHKLIPTNKLPLFAVGTCLPWWQFRSVLAETMLTLTVVNVSELMLVFVVC